ncbi:TPA: sugar transferase [Streptococcus suis]|uniref:Cps2E n=1 Tax=Streptococcus suis TaxID=1307 RepID=A0A0Z8K2Y0_STRSU|nr:sugar transferase [Streptococcus suis]MDW8727086.1 sugar transferase [Streptococcus suis]NQG64812.1 sugar transferase [Streptococcus suis]NQG66598.1 sugar transferase [Streptococcus suis]CYV43497.1 Cps2E [Streptococcus suis]CYV64703.1 Cps2E [Streptococcus suis]
MINTNGHRQIRLAILELVAVVFAVFITSQFPDSDLNRTGILSIIVLHFFAFNLSKLYVEIESRGYLAEMEKTLIYSLIFAFLLTFVSFMLEKEVEISRRGVVYFSIINFCLVYLSNCFVRKYKHFFLITRNQQKNTLLITTPERFQLMKDLFESELLSTRYLVGVVILGEITDELELVTPIIPVDKAVDFATHEVVDHVFINLPSEFYDLKVFVSEFEILGIDVSVDINSFDFQALRNKKIQQVGDHSIVTFSSNFYKTNHIFLKRLLDILGSIVGLIFCGLVSVVLVPLIRKDGGPAIFVQKRVGKNGRVFKFYKFRSMHIDAEERKKELLAQNQMQGGMFKMDNDPRITPIGHFIRKTSLDELPQFYNVLRGDMSLVGTRPPTVDEFEKYSPSQKRRLSFKPGITGLWQVSGRSNITNFDEVVKLDVEYIDNWTIWSDVKILLKTLVVVFKREGSK